LAKIRAAGLGKILAAGQREFEDVAAVSPPDFLVSVPQHFQRRRIDVRNHAGIVDAADAVGRCVENHLVIARKQLQFLLGPVRAKDIADAVFQHRPAQRFANVVNRAGAVGAFNAPFVVQGRHHQHRRRVGHGAADVLADAGSVYARHGDVQDDQIKGLLRRLLQGLMAVLRLNDRIALALQKLAHEHADHFVVVDNQNDRCGARQKGDCHSLCITKKRFDLTNSSTVIVERTQD